MMKRMKKTISFLLAACLLAGSGYGYVNAEAADTVATIETTDNTGNNGTTGNTGNTGNSGTTGNTGTNGVVGQKVAFMDPYKTTEFIEKGDPPIAFTKTLTLTINGIDDKGEPIPISGNISIESVNADSDIVRIESQGNVGEEGGQKYQVVLTALAPGRTQVVASVFDSETNLRYNIVCMVEVSLMLDRSDSVWRTVDGVEKKVLVFEQMEEGYKLQLSGVKNEAATDTSKEWIGSIDNTLIEWIGTNNSIVSVDEVSGIIKPLSAGSTTITLQTLKNADGKPLKEEIDVVVVPLGSTVKDGTLIREPAKYDTPYEPGAVSSFILYTNGNPANNINWTVYSATYDGLLGGEPTWTEIKENATDKNLIWRAGSDENDRNLYFTGVKAGTYKVVGLSAGDNKYKDQAWNRIEFNIVVALDFSGEKVIYMNVDDSYSIMSKLNMPENLFSELWKIQTSGDAGGMIASIDRKTGVVTAKRKGNYVVTLTYNKESKYSIFPVGNENCDVTQVISFNISDELLLNENEITLAVGAQYQLEYLGYGSINATDIDSVKWTSSNEKYAVVDENTGMVTAKTATNDNPVEITLTVTMKDGTIKTAKCRVYVKDSITKITMQPESLELAIGEIQWVRAVPDKAPLGSRVYFKSSDENVFIVAEPTEDFSAQIQAVGGGTAELVAVNADNVIVGFCTVTVIQEATGVKILKEDFTTKLSQGSIQLYAEVLPENATNQKVYWESSNKKVAVVDKDTGLVTYKKAGTVTIFAKTDDLSGSFDFVNIVIQDVMENISLDQTEIEMYTGESRRLSYTADVSDSLLGNTNLIWTSFNTSVVAVDKTGMLTAKGPGTTQVMVMSEENGNCYALCTVTVKQKATGVKMSYKQLSMNRGEYFDMQVSVTPATSTEASLIWESLSPSVATVSSTGRIMARAEGTAIIAVRTQNGVTSYCTVTVLEPVTSLELDPTDLLLDVGEVFQIDPVFKPVEPSNKNVKWSSYDSRVATVNAMGEVEAISRGSTVIMCETADGGYRAFCMVTVVDPNVVITINPDTYRLGYGEYYTLEATVTNHGEVVTDMEVVWMSDDEDVCTVDSQGRIYGEDYGFATISAVIEEGGYYFFATCEVRVVREVTSIKLNHSAITIIQGNTASLHADVQPSDATYTDAIFSSEDDSIAIVDEDGTITALTPGTTWIWAKAKDNSGKYARCFVTVIAPIPATGITVSDKQIVLLPGEKKQLNFAMKPTTSTDDVTWTAGEEAIATVNGSGLVTAHRVGTTTVTAMTSSGKTTQIEVIVLGLSRTSVELPVYTQYSKLTVEGATGTVRWDVEDTSICEVKNGVITARKVGTTEVIATVNGRTLRCKVTVLPNDKKK